MKIFALCISSFLLLFLASCVTFDHETYYTLCFDRATSSPNGNKSDARETEIRTRGIDCRIYEERIDREAFAIKLAEAGATRVNTTNIIEYDGD